MQQSIDKVRKIAFRLILVNLVEDVPIVAPATSSTTEEAEETADFTNASDKTISHSFLESLVGFLNQKVT